MAEIGGQVPLGWRGSLGMAQKLRLVLGGLVAVMALVLVLSMVLVARLAGEEHRLSHTYLAFTDATAQAALQAKGVANDERGFLMSGDTHFLDEADRRIVAARGALRSARASAQSTEEKDSIRAASAGFDAWVAALDDEFTTYTTDRSAATKASLGPTRDLRKSYESALARADALGEASVDSGTSTVSSRASELIRVLVVCLVVVLILGLLVTRVVIHWIALPLHRLATLLTG